MSVSNRIASLTPEQRALFELLRQKQRQSTSQSASPPPFRNVSGPTGVGDWPLSYDQERLWFLHFLDPESTAYNMVSVVRLLGRLDAAALERTFREIVRRHAAWRTTFPIVDGLPVQRVAPELDQAMPLIDLTALPEEVREATALAVAHQDGLRPFSLERGPLVWVTLVRLGDRRHVWVLTVHHIVNDWVSFQMFWQEWGIFYEAFALGGTWALAMLPEVRYQYADFATWQREWMTGAVLEEHVGWWKEQLEGFPRVLELPEDRPRRATETPRGGRLPVRLDEDLTNAFRALAQREGTTRFMVLIALTAVLFHRLSGQEKLVTGTLNANRNRPEVENVFGFFLTQLPFPIDLSGDPTFRELLARVRKVALAAFAHQELPFGKLVESLQPDRDLSRQPLVQTLVQLLDVQVPVGAPPPEVPPQDDRRLQMQNLSVDDDNARYEVMLNLYELNDVIGGPLEYNAEVFDATTIRRMIDLFFLITRASVADPGLRLSELPAFPEGVRQQLLVEWNDTVAALPEGEPGTVVELFAAQAARTPEAEAWTGDGWRLTYAELDERSNRLARHLRRLGAGPGELVGIYLERTAELPVALLGVLKSGAAYLPFDLTHPADRRAFMLEEAHVIAVLTQERLLPELPPGVRTISLDTGRLGDESGAPPASPAPEDRAYVIYTSGSTGRPKGVEIPHRALANFVHAMRRLYRVAAGDAMPAITTIAFDLSVPELYLPMLGGGTTPLLARETAADGVLLARALDDFGATVLQATPATYRQLLASGWQGRPEMLLLCGAEAMSRDLADRLLPLGRGLWNFYGPTETTVWSTAWQVEPEAPISVGRPIANTRIYLLDGRYLPVPLGSYGEVCIGGDGLARGYFRRPELTAERFIPDPLSGEPGARLYRTGDLARYRTGGLLEYAGRADHQVKLRGFRIEPGEIEARLRQHPQIAEAAVLLREDRPGDQRLIAYMAVGENEAPSTAELRGFLRESLPDYMVPATFVALPALPRNANGKIDRRALQPPEPRAEAAAAFEAPATPTEELIAGIWCEVLGRARVGRSDNFFELGGHSLLATQVVVRLEQTAGVELPVRELFQAPTIEALAAVVDTRRAAGQGAAARPPLVAVPREGDLPLSFAQERLWFIDQLAPGTPAYNVPGAMRLEGDLPVPRLTAALAALAGRHETLRTSFVDQGGRPVLRIAPPPATWELPVLDLSGLEEATRQREAARLGMVESLLSFDLSRGPLLRTLLVRLAPTEHVLLFDTHHIISDAWSAGVLIADLATLAAGESAGRRLPDLPVQYADYAVWQRRWLDGPEVERQLAYWRERLAGAPTALELPTDRPRPLDQSFRGGSVDLPLSPELSAELIRLGRREGATLFMIVLSAWGALLGRLSGQPDLLIGAAVANRDRPELERLVGLFINTLPLRVEGADDPSFSTLLSRVRRTVLDAFAHRDMPFERLIEELQLARDRSRQPLVQVLLTYINTPPQEIEVSSGLDMGPVAIESTTSKFDLTLGATEAGDRLVTRLEYASDLFDAATAARWMGHLATLLAGAVEDPGRTLPELPLLAPEERRQILEEWSRGAAPAPRQGLIHELFARQAARTPAALALVWGDERWTYADLAARVEPLARRLRRLGVRPEVRVGIATRRTPEMVLSLLAVLTAGGAYVPLDPTYPAERLAFLVGDAGVRLVLTEAGFDPRIPVDAGVERLEVTRKVEPEEEGGAEGASPLPENLAYLIYTSGSTGQPKGVMVRHGSAADFVAWAARAFSAQELSRVLASTSLAFDLSVFELFVPLAVGGAVILADDILRLPALPAAGEVTLVNTVPSALSGMLRLAPLPAAVATVNLAGEPLPESLADALWRQPGVRRVLDLYGPSEDTTYSTWAASAPGARPLIGRPVDGTRAYLLDRNLQPVPPGIPGEICLGGAGLARGYLNRPDLTAERFVPDPFADSNGERVYRTGDLARWLAGGEIDYLGRTDFQVKIRGFRVEPGEVEAVIARHPQLRACAVLVRRDPQGESRLVAYVVPGNAADAADSAEELQPRDFRRWLRGRLPEHLIPSLLVPLMALPVTENGKLDRAALPEPVWGGDAEGVHVPPSTALEENVVQICTEVLGLPAGRIGMRDNFFALGGHSLLATQLIARLREEYGIEVSLEEVFDTADLRELTDRIVERELADAGDDVLTELLGEVDDLSPEELREMLGQPDPPDPETEAG